MSKKVIFLAAGLLFVCEVAFFLWFYAPKPVNHTLHGVAYQLGDNQEIEPKTIHVEGTLKRHLKGTKTFSGVINISGEEIPVPAETLTIRLENYSGLMHYATVENGRAVSYSYGTVYINQDFSQLTIAKYSETEDPNRKIWSGKNGLMISAPAADRDEALALSNQLMRDFLQNPLK